MRVFVACCLNNPAILRYTFRAVCIFIEITARLTNPIRSVSRFGACCFFCGNLNQTVDMCLRGIFPLCVRGHAPAVYPPALLGVG